MSTGGTQPGGSGVISGRFSRDSDGAGCGRSYVSDGGNSSNHVVMSALHKHRCDEDADDGLTPSSSSSSSRNESAEFESGSSFVEMSPMVLSVLR